ncbi:unnamed protein product [Rotaria sordida]|uniref:Uncharacterized protein n=1 Tax=Rotaria sordida TaxID=392033 RepID=A0A815KFX1_9BILA|nr:unnamed protein product [Rotaria sordida]
MIYYECSSTISGSASELYPPLTTNLTRGHSRQVSKSSSDEESHNQSQRRLITKRRVPCIDQFGDIQRRLHSTRVDASEVVNSVINNTAKTVENPNGYLCLMYNEDRTSRVG